MMTDTTIPDKAATDIRVMIADRPMSATQIVGVLTTLALTMADGFDILSMSFAGPQLIAETRLTKAAFGIVMAMNLAGIGIGSVLLSALADRFGRRRVILIAMLVISATMALTALAATTVQLCALRFATGLAIGAMAGPSLSLASEYANARNRVLTVSVMSLGFPAGAALGALAASAILAAYSWHALFVAGAILTLAVAVCAYFTLPESIDFLATKDDPASRRALATIAARFGVAGPIHVSPVAADARGLSFARLFAPSMWGTTAAMLAINFLMMGTIYFFLGWLPQIVADRGFDPSSAASVSMVQNLGGVMGAIAMGLFARRYPPVRVAALALGLTALAVAYFGALPPSLGVIRAVAGVEGFLAVAGIAGVYGILATAFPTDMRSTGIGIAMASGRLGMVLATVQAGFLYTWDWSATATGALLATGAIGAALVLMGWSAKARG